MNFQLVQGGYNTADAIELLSKMMEVKINFHEGKISETTAEEDIKFRENKIKKLQNDLAELKKLLSSPNTRMVNINAEIEVEILNH
jgi:hypothetical protein